MRKDFIIEMWEALYGKAQEVYDYAGRRIVKAACGNPNSSFQPVIDHVRPCTNGGKHVRENIVICNWETKEERGHKFPHWWANGHLFCAKKVKSGYCVLKKR